MRGLEWEWRMRRDDQWQQSLRDALALMIFVALSFSGFALIQLAGVG
jgi:hypothetical protein